MTALTEPTEQEQRILAKRYRLLLSLGAGESAQVFLAEDLALGRRVAIKILRPELNHNQAFRRRMRAEAHAVAILNHPNIVRVFDWVEEADRPFLVLEYLAGGNLRDMLDRGTRLSPAQAVRVGAQVARGLAYAHSRGVVHRDIKPANLLFDEEGWVRVADFGIARARAEAAWIEPHGAFIGTPRYSAPEQARAGSLDGRADIYSLALVLYEAITGTVPFTEETIAATLMAKADHQLPSHPALRSLYGLLNRAANPDVSARLDASQLVTCLDAAAADFPPPALLSVVPSKEMSDAWRTGRDADLQHDATTISTPALQHSDSMLATAHPDDTVSWQHGANAPIWPERSLPRPVLRRHRRRWPWVVGIVVMALAAGGLAVAWHEKVFTPSHPVPSLKGQSPAAARRKLGRAHFILTVGAHATSTTVHAGLVISQQPRASTSLKEGEIVTVVVSSGLPTEAVPSLVGLSCYGATRLLEIVHLKAVCPPAAAAYNDVVPLGQVLNWSFDNRLNVTQAPFGSTIFIAISEGKQVVTVPTLLSATYAQALATLKAQGLQVTEVQESSVTVRAGSVTRTLPPAGATALTGSTVIVFVSRGPAIMKIPNVGHDTVPVASAALEKAGFSVGAISGPPGGHLISTDPPAGQFEPQGTTVNLVTQ